MPIIFAKFSPVSSLLVSNFEISEVKSCVSNELRDVVWQHNNYNKVKIRVLDHRKVKEDKII